MGITLETEGCDLVSGQYLLIERDHMGLNGKAPAISPLRSITTDTLPIL